MAAERSLRIVHAVSTDAFAGVERSILLSARALTERGHDVIVVGGEETTMRASLGPLGVPWHPASSTLGVARALWNVGGVDIVHAHMTEAELGAVLTRKRNGGRLVVTRHFAQRRGATPGGRAASALIERVPHTEIAISRYVESAIGVPSVLVHHGVVDREAVAGPANQVVVIQRLEVEKDTALAIRAWACSGLGDEAWELVIAGDGADRPALQALAQSLGVSDSVRFLGHVTDVDVVRANAALQFATPASEHFGLSVLEAMSVGLAVLAADGGAHRELLGDEYAADALFRPGDAEDAGRKLRRLAADADLRGALGEALRRRQRTMFSLSAHGEALEGAYCHPIARGPEDSPLMQLVVLAQEDWDEPSARGKALVLELLRVHPDLRVLWVGPPDEPLKRRWRSGGQARSTASRVRRGASEARLAVLRPQIWLPQRVRPRADEALCAQIRRSIKQLGFDEPVLWVCDRAYAPLVRSSEWRAVYDTGGRTRDKSITTRRRRRLEAYGADLMVVADEVVGDLSAEELWTVLAGEQQPRGPDRRFRVLFVGHTAVESGGELALARLLPGMTHVDAHVVLGQDGAMVKRFREVGATVEVLAIDEAARGVKRDAVVPGRLPFAALLATMRYTWRLARRTRQIEPDLVHTNTLKAAIYGGIAGRLARVPVVWHIRDRIAPDYLPSFAVWAIRTLGRLVPAAIITNSMSTRSTLGLTTRMIAVTPSPVVYDAVSAAVLPPPCGESAVIGMVGRLAAWKGQDVFVRAFAQAFPDGPERAIIVGGALFGEDDFAAELTTLIAELGLEDRVELTGHVDDVPAALARMHVVVHASVIPEPFGQVVIEAMAAGRPIIATNAGGPAEIIEDGVDGVLVRPGDVDELAEAMKRLARDPDERDRLARAARSAVERFLPERIGPQVERIYARVARPLRNA